MTRKRRGSKVTVPRFFCDSPDSDKNCLAAKPSDNEIMRRLVCLICIGVLTACGGGGGGGDDSSGGGGGSDTWMPGVFLPADSFAAQCVAPRSGIDPSTGQPFPDVSGSRTDENNWLRSWSNDLYLWYREITDVDPAVHTTPDYFDLMKTFAATASGSPKDNFHGTLSTAEWQALSQSGVAPGYGAEWLVVAATPPRLAVVAYTHPNSPATTAPANLARGAIVLTVDGVDVENGNDIDTLNAGLFPVQAGETHQFTILDLGSVTPRAVTLQSANVTMDPVQNVGVVGTATGNVGYILFLDHLATAEQALIDAVNQLQPAGITDLVLDIRYNGGGFLAIASELAYMIAGAVPTAGRTFEEVRFNDKHPSTNPVTGSPLEPVPFLTTAVGLSTPSGQGLPTLNLPRVFVLTGPNTCSASEAIMNSLQGVNVEVIQIGSTTCGKPYGFFPADNCGTTYFSIQFQGFNAKGFGDYPDGFSPNNTVGTVGTLTPGCSVADDFTHALGDPTESRFATALAYRNTQSCPAPTGISPLGVARDASARSLSAADGRLNKSPWLSNRIYRTDKQ